MLDHLQRAQIARGLLFGLIHCQKPRISGGERIARGVGKGEANRSRGVELVLIGIVCTLRSVPYAAEHLTLARLAGGDWHLPLSKFPKERRRTGSEVFIPSELLQSTFPQRYVI
jgi:hypothetical protein